MKNINKNRQFSISFYLFIVFILSWPFQFAYGFLGENYRPLLLISMIMVAVATYISGKFVFKDGFKQVGWRWGDKKFYIYSFALTLFLWLFPSVLEQSLDIYHPKTEIYPMSILGAFLLSFFITLIPAFSEEFAWRGYLLPHLFSQFKPKKALLIHGLTTWLWHIPVLVIMGDKMGNPVVTVPTILLISLIPTVMHAIVFAYLWDKSQSIALSTFYHTAFDEVRDSLEGSVGLGVLGQNWQMLILTLLGIFALYKARWKKINLS